MKEVFKFLLNKFKNRFYWSSNTAKKIIVAGRDKDNVIESRDEIVHDILEKNEIFTKLGADDYYYVRIFERSGSALNIVDAYSRWEELEFSKLITPFGLPRKNNDFMCPQNLFLLKIVCFDPNFSLPPTGEELTDDYSLWILVDPKNKEIVDVRCEVGTRVFH